MLIFRLLGFVAAFVVPVLLDNRGEQPQCQERNDAQHNRYFHPAKGNGGADGSRASDARSGREPSNICAFF